VTGLRPEAAGPVTRLRSKRNVVERCFLPGAGWVVRKDFEDNREGYRTELEMLRRLTGALVRVPPVIWAEEPVILSRWINGETLADLLDQAEASPGREKQLARAVPLLCRWLGEFYEASGGLILGDAHLRNFLLFSRGLERKLYGVDFEACRPGAREEDIARLAVFTLTYDPALTEKKRRLAGMLLGECRKRLELSLPRLEEALFRELEGLCSRRSLPTEIQGAYRQGVEALISHLS
jgi:hypothetical protein